MKSRKLSIGLIVLALCGAGALYAGAQTGQPGSAKPVAFAQPPATPAAKPAEKNAKAEEADEEVIPFAKAPEAVRSAALKLVGADGEKAIKKVTKEENEADAYTYEIDYTAGGVDCSAVFSTAGETMELEKSAKESTLPAAAIAALKKHYSGAKFDKIVSVQKFYYEVQVVTEGKSHEVKVDASGDIEDEHAEHAEKGEKHEAEKSKK